MHELLKFLKLLGVLGFAAGLVGGLYAPGLEARQKFAYRLAGPAFGVTWFFGFVLVHEGSLNVLSSWILGGLALSLLSLQALLFSVGREGREGAVTSAVVLGSLAGTVALMVWKPA